MDVRRLRGLQNCLPARIASRREQRNMSHHPLETTSLDALLAGLATGKTLQQSVRFYLCGLFTLLVITDLLAWISFAFGFGAGSLVAIVLFPVCVIPVVLRLRADSERRCALLQLTGYDDLRVIALLTEALFARDRRLRVAARIALIRLLPQLEARDGGLLPTPQRQLLYRCLSLRHAQNAPELACAVLQALEQIGDRRALPYVHALACTRYAESIHTPRQAARHCLPFLNTRIEQAQACDTLLLPASAQPAQRHETLLHPACQTVLRTEPAQETQRAIGK